MKSSAKCSKPRLAALLIVTSLLSACATVSSKPVIGVCPPVVGYDDGYQARAAGEAGRGCGRGHAERLRCHAGAGELLKKTPLVFSSPRCQACYMRPLPPEPI